MSKLILKATPANNTADDRILGYLDTTGKRQLLVMQAQPMTVYRLVDAKSGEVIKIQTVLRQGKDLQAKVDGVIAVELDNFFQDEGGNTFTAEDSPTYLVDTNKAAVPIYGGVTALTPVEQSSDGMLLWAPGMAAMPLVEPVAFGAPVLAAMAGTGNTLGMVAAVVGTAAFAGSGSSGGDSGGGTLGSDKTPPMIQGTSFKAEVDPQNNEGLVVEAFIFKDNTMVSLGKSTVGMNGYYHVDLASPTPKGSVILKMSYDPDAYEKLTGVKVTKAAKFYDEASGETKDFTQPLYAVANYGGADKTISVNITPLTNLAATVAGVDTSKNIPTFPSNQSVDAIYTLVKEANIKAVQQFGLNVADLAEADVQTTNSDTVNDYGIALALVSQMENDGVDILDAYKKGDLNTKIAAAVDKLNNYDVTTSSNPYLKSIDKSKLADLLTLQSDKTPPKLIAGDSVVQANTSMDGTKVYLHFDSVLSKNTAGVSAFKVNVTPEAVAGSTPTASPAEISSIAIEGQDVVLTLKTAITKGQTVSVTYNNLTPATDDLQVIQDVAGNDAQSITDLQVKNYAETPKPTLAVKAGQSFSYDENQTDKTISAILKVALDNGSITPSKFRFTDSQSSISKDGWYSIDKDGLISLTSAGLGRDQASNDYEVNKGAALVYGVQAGDDAGNWSNSVNVKWVVKDVVSEAPRINAPASFTVLEDDFGNLLFGSNPFVDPDSDSLTVTLTVVEIDDILFGIPPEDAMGGVKETQVKGGLRFEGKTSDLNTFFSTADNFAYKDIENYNGPRELKIEVSDGNSTTTAYSKIRVTAVNDAPSGTDKTLTVLEDGSKTLTENDFGFEDKSDSPVNQLSAVIITSLPTAGSLKFDNKVVTKGQSIAVADLSKLVYTPAPNASGDAYDTIGFKVQDNGGTANGGVNTSTAKTLTFNVTPVNDAPTQTSTPLTVEYIDPNPSQFDAWSVRDTSKNEMASFVATTLYNNSSIL